MKLLFEGNFYADLLEALGQASEVLISVFQYDHPKVQEKLLFGLRHGLRLDVVVDSQGSSTCRYMGARLKELRKAGGHVHERSGHNHRAICGPSGAHLTGHLHHKIIVVDRRIGYVGSKNLTRSSETNRECVMKVKGPVVKELVQAVRDCIGDS